MRNPLVRAASALIAALAVVPVGGCYTYRSIEPETANPDKQVRVHVTPAGATQHGTVLSQDGRWIDGVLIAPPDGGLTVAVPHRDWREGYGYTSSRDTVDIAFDYVRELQERKLNAGQTVATVAGGTAAVVLVAYAILSSTEGGITGGPGDGPRASRAPAISIGFAIP